MSYKIQQELSTILNNIHIKNTNYKETCEKFINISNEYKFILFKIELEDDYSVLITFTYTNGSQKFNLITRDYRGEGIVFDKKTNIFHNIRPAMQVFPEMVSIDTDDRAYYYLKPFLENENSENINIKQFIMTPKYDGSLFNLTIINKNHMLYNLINNLINKNKNIILSTAFYYDKDSNLYLIGSKGCCITSNPVNQRIHNAINQTYNNINDFIEYFNDITKKINNNEQNIIYTYHFEAIDKNTTDELVVKYNDSSCIFIGLTSYNSNTNKKTFYLPNQLISIKNPVEYKEFSNYKEVKNWYNNQENIFMEGKENYDKIEPEGFVLYLITNKNEIVPIKYKFKIYYIAHKPFKYFEEYYSIYKNNNNNHIKKRIEIFNKYTTIEEIIKEFDLENKINNLLELEKEIEKNNNIIELKFVNIKDKKSWAIYWKKNNNIFDKLLFDLDKIIKNNIFTKHIQVPSSFNFIVNLYDNTKINNLNFEKIKF
jgi:hypothetical protein